jgi:protein O-GlcNAc transferase
VIDINHIEQLLARGAVAEARAALEKLLAAEPKHADARKRMIDVATVLGDLAASLQHARLLAGHLPGDLDAMFYLAKAELGAGHFDAAWSLAEKLNATAAKDSAAFQFLKGNIHAARGEITAAIAAYEMALTLDPGYTIAWNNLALVHQRTGDFVSVKDALQRYLAVDPHNKDALVQMARACRALGDLNAAQSYYERALAVAPNEREILIELGNLLVEAFRFDRAKEVLTRLFALGADEKTENLLAYTLNEMGETAEAVAVLARPSSVAPSLARRVRSALMLPQVYESADALREARECYAQGLADLCAAEAANELNANEVFQLSQSNFLLAYQGENDLALQTQYADFVARLIAKTRPDLVELIDKRALAGKRIKVLYVSSYFRECTIGHYFRSWITELDAARFERKVIHTGAQPDKFARDMAAQCDGFSVQRGGVLQVAEAIRAGRADIIIYPEVGMGSMNYLLTNMRLAPVQCAAWGHPVTTGSGAIDYYFTCGEMEGANAGDHYREKLLRLPGIGTSYSAPSDVAAITRNQLGLTDAHHLFVCPQSLFKVHPDNDDVFIDIMAADANAVILFFQGSWPAITQAFGARISRRMAERGLPARGQIKFLPRMDEAGFRGLLAGCDIVLDTLHWSGGNTSLDALSVGAPIVTLPGEFMRGRQTMAMLRAMGAEELLAESRTEYVQKAIEFASDAVANKRLREKLLANRGAVFDRREAIPALADHLFAMHENISRVG